MSDFFHFSKDRLANTLDCKSALYPSSLRKKELSAKLLSCSPDFTSIYILNPSRNLDGSFFGTTFPHLLLLQLDEKPKCSFNYIPRIFGFKLASNEYIRPTQYKQFVGRKNFLSYSSKK